MDSVTVHMNLQPLQDILVHGENSYLCSHCIISDFKKTLMEMYVDNSINVCSCHDIWHRYLYFSVDRTML